MVCIKANDEIVKVYQRIIAAMRERVEWNGDIIIRKNTMILVGRVRSMYFELAARRVYSDIEELEFDRANAFEMGNNNLITNIINMLLYIKFPIFFFIFCFLLYYIYSFLFFILITKSALSSNVTVITKFAYDGSSPVASVIFASY